MAHDEAYREAEQKIEEAWRTGATELDPRSMKLAKIPESLAALVQLQMPELS